MVISIIFNYQRELTIKVYYAVIKSSTSKAWSHINLGFQYIINLEFL